MKPGNINVDAKMSPNIHKILMGVMIKIMFDGIANNHDTQGSDN